MAGRALGTLGATNFYGRIEVARGGSPAFRLSGQGKNMEVSSFRKLHLDILAETETRKLNASLKIKDLENLVIILDQLQKNQQAEVNYESIRDQGIWMPSSKSLVYKRRSKREA